MMLSVTSGPKERGKPAMALRAAPGLAAHDDHVRRLHIGDLAPRGLLLALHALRAQDEVRADSH